MQLIQEQMNQQFLQMQQQSVFISQLQQQQLLVQQQQLNPPGQSNAQQALFHKSASNSNYQTVKFSSSNQRSSNQSIHGVYNSRNLSANYSGRSQ